jgi:hypothetical protein
MGRREATKKGAVELLVDMEKIGEEDEHDTWVLLPVRVACNHDQDCYFSGAPGSPWI